MEVSPSFLFFFCIRGFTYVFFIDEILQNKAFKPLIIFPYLKFLNNEIMPHTPFKSFFRHFQGKKKILSLNSSHYMEPFDTKINRFSGLELSLMTTFSLHAGIRRVHLSLHTKRTEK